MWTIYASPFRLPMGYRGRGCCVTPARLSFKRPLIVLSGDIVFVRSCRWPSSALAGQNNRYERRRPGVVQTYAYLLVVTKTSVMCAKAQPSTRTYPRRHARGFADRMATAVGLGRVDVLRGSNCLRASCGSNAVAGSPSCLAEFESRLTDLSVTGPEVLASSRAWHHALQS